MLDRTAVTSLAPSPEEVKTVFEQMSHHRGGLIEYEIFNAANTDRNGRCDRDAAERELNEFRTSGYCPRHVYDWCLAELATAKKL